MCKMVKMKTVLGIESSCDDTAVAIYDAEQGILSHSVYSQIETHAKYGGVVPELASRDHLRKCLPLVDHCLQEAGIDKRKLDGIAYTSGPGLLPSLLVGSSFARTLGYALNIPTLGIHHMEAHLMVAMLEAKKPRFPFVALLVSGGHTMLVKVNALGSYELIGETLDDAAGEAFDKTAKLLGLPYPGGPAIAELAKKGDAKCFKFSRPMCDRPGCDFSFSGLKTQAVYTYNNHEKSEQLKANVARSFEDAVVDTLYIKCKRALEITDLNQLVMVGGVSANRKLREKLSNELSSIETFYPRPEHCTDNGVMVAYLGYLRLARGEHDSLAINARARWPLCELS